MVHVRRSRNHKEVAAVTIPPRTADESVSAFAADIEVQQNHVDSCALQNFQRFGRCGTLTGDFEFAFGRQQSGQAGAE
jgi:hypothetical protein